MISSKKLPLLVDSVCKPRNLQKIGFNVLRSAVRPAKTVIIKKIGLSLEPLSKFNYFIKRICAWRVYGKLQIGHVIYWPNC